MDLSLRRIDRIVALLQLCHLIEDLNAQSTANAGCKLNNFSNDFKVTDTFFIAGIKS